MRVCLFEAPLTLALALGAHAAGASEGVDFSGCFLGASRCCSAASTGAEQRALCCKRAVQDCARPQAPLLLAANWPAALGNALIQLHDAVLLAHALGRALLLPPVLGEPAAVELEPLADAFAIDIVVADRFSWGAACSTGPGAGDRAIVFEVSGGARVGPYRDQQRSMADGDMPLPHELLEAPKVRGDGVWSYELRGTADFSQSGRWWGVQFPHSIQLMYWEALLGSPTGQLPDVCGVLGEGDGVADDAASHLDRTTKQFPLPPEWIGDQIMKQHPCLVPLLADLQRPPANQQCLVVAQLFNSVHWGLHQEEHLRFFQNLRFAADIRNAVARWTSPGGALSQPYVAVHVRSFILFEDGETPKFNLSAAEAGFATEMRRAVRAVRQQYPDVVGPPIFLAADNTRHPLVQRLLLAAQALQGKVGGASSGAAPRKLLLTSDDTKSGAGGAPHRHVAVDALLCARAAAFVGTGVSSLTGAVAALRRATAATAAQGQGSSAGLLLSSFWPRRPSVYFDTQIFPTTAWLPSSSSITRFFAKLAEEIRGTPPSASSQDCVREPSESARRPHHVFLEHTKLQNVRPLTSEELRSIWWTAIWECPSVAVLVHLQWIVSHLNVSRTSRSRAIEGAPWGLERSLEEQAHFIHKVWYLLWMGRLTLGQLASAELRDTALALLRKRTGLRTRCGDGEVAAEWEEAPGSVIERSNRGPGDCLLVLHDVGGLPAGTVLMDVRTEDFFCPAEPPLKLGPSERGQELRGAPVPPIALRLVQKAASTSALTWAADMEGLRAVHVALASRILRLGEAGLNEVLDEMGGLGCSEARRKAWSQRLLQFMPRFLGLPPHLCPSRCRGGAGRQKVAVVRNPFKRLASWFSNWIESLASGEEPLASSMDRSLDSWADFGRWVARLRPWLRRVHRQHCNGTANFRDWDMWRHLLPMSVVLAGRSECPVATAEAQASAADAGGYAVVRLETADEDIRALETRLCARTGAPCRRLPPLRRHNSGFERVRTPPWDTLWDVGIVRHVLRIYRVDFEAFGYSSDPRSLKPVGPALEMPAVG